MGFLEHLKLLGACQRSPRLCGVPWPACWILGIWSQDASGWICCSQKMPSQCFPGCEIARYLFVSAVLPGTILNCRASRLHQSKNENQCVMGRHADELFTAVVQAAVQNSLKHRRWQLCIALDRPNAVLPWKSTGRSCCFV